jgi:hypothetical protein
MMIAREPFSYAHYTDGEFLAMKEVDGHTDRGMDNIGRNYLSSVSSPDAHFAKKK